MSKARIDRLVREASVAPPHAFVEDLFVLWEIIVTLGGRLRQRARIRPAATPELERAVR